MARATSKTIRNTRLAESAAGMSKKALNGLGTRALQNIQALGSLEKFGSRAGQGRRASKNIKAILDGRKSGG